MSKCRAHVQIMDFLRHAAQMNLNVLLQEQQAAPSAATVACPWKMWSSQVKAGGAKAVFHMCKMMYLAKATWFSQLSCHRWGWLYPSRTQPDSTEALPTVLSLNRIRSCSAYSVTALLIHFTVGTSICQLLFHSFYFPVPLISEETLKIQSTKPHKLYQWLWKSVLKKLIFLTNSVIKMSN